MKRFVRILFLVLLLAFVAGAGMALYNSKDPAYTLHEWVNPVRFHRYDDFIRQAGTKYRIDPMLLKAVIWRESAFHPEMVGRNGERGLMQVTEAAAKDWAKSQKVDSFQPDSLFDPQTNIEVGAWYLKQSLQYYSGKDDPVPFALAEYNAGRQRVHRWIGENNLEPVTANDLEENISFPSTKRYVLTTIDRYRFYKKRERM